MSHRCLHGRFSCAAAIELNESRGPLRTFTTDELVNVVMYYQFLFFKSLAVIVKFISSVILCNAVDLYSFP
jgi:hypothetical protein